VGNNEDNIMARDLKASHHHEDTRCVLPESYSAEGGRCPSVASDGTNKTSGTKMRKRQLQCLEESVEENKKIRKLLTASIRGDSLRNCADALRNEIRSIESHEIANAQLLSNCLEREDSQNNLRRTYKLQHCKAAGNPDEQEILVRIMEDISENLASFSSEIATIRDKATALSERATFAHPRETFAHLREWRHQRQIRKRSSSFRLSIIYDTRQVHIMVLVSMLAYPRHVAWTA
jgi:hypothetical protein